MIKKLLAVGMAILNMAIAAQAQEKADDASARPQNEVKQPPALRYSKGELP